MHHKPHNLIRSFHLQNTVLPPIVNTAHERRCFSISTRPEHKMPHSAHPNGNRKGSLAPERKSLKCEADEAVRRSVETGARRRGRHPAPCLIEPPSFSLSLSFQVNHTDHSKFELRCIQLISWLNSVVKKARKLGVGLQRGISFGMREERDGRQASIYDPAAQ